MRIDVFAGHKKRSEKIEMIRLCPGFSKRKARGIFGKSGSLLTRSGHSPASVARSNEQAVKWIANLCFDQELRACVD